MEHLVSAVSKAMLSSGNGLTRFMRIYVGSLLTLSYAIGIATAWNTTATPSLADALVAGILFAGATVPFLVIPVAIVVVILWILFGGLKS
jgi:hypothetical protein